MTRDILSMQNESAAPVVTGPAKDRDGRLSPVHIPLMRSTTGTTSEGGARRAWQRPLWIIAVCALIELLRFGRAALIPPALALLVALVLSGIVEGLRRRGVPRALSAAVLLVLIAAALGGIVDGIAAPARDWLQSAPRVLRTIEQKMRPAQSLLRRLDYITRRASAMATSSNDAAAPAPANTPASLPPLSALEIFAATSWAALGTVTVLAFAFLLLSAGPRNLARLGEALTGDLPAVRALQIIDAVRREVGRYYGTLLLINLCFGLLIGTIMWSLGMPNPALWGVLAGVLNFIPYLGPAVTAAILTVVALVTFSSIAHVMGVLCSYVGLATIEGHIVEPFFLGRRLKLHPLLVLLALWTGGWLWGVAGVLLALPTLLAVNVMRRITHGDPQQLPTRVSRPVR